MASSSSSSNEVVTTIQKPNCAAANFVSNCLLFPSFLQTPFAHPSLRHSKTNLITTTTTTTTTTVPNSIQDVQKSLVSIIDRCFKTINSIVAAGNPAFQKLFSLSAGFGNFCQIHCRNSRNPSSLSAHNFAAILPGDSVAGIVVTNGILNFLNLYNTLLVVRLVLTWFPNSPPAIVGPLSTLCDPYLNIFRGIIPPLGGTLDLSPILAFLVLNAFTSTASALPAELPVAGASQEGHSSSDSRFSHLTTTQKKWMRRICGNGARGLK